MKLWIIVTIFLIFLIPEVFAESISNDIGSMVIDESIFEISRDSEFTLKIYGIINPEQNNNKGHIQITLPDGNTKGQLFIPTNEGYFEYFFDINYKSQIGDYKILGTYGNKIIGNLIFSVSEKQFTINEIKEVRDEISKTDKIREAEAKVVAEEEAKKWNKALAEAKVVAEAKEVAEAKRLAEAKKVPAKGESAVKVESAAKEVLRYQTEVPELTPLEYLFFGFILFLVMIGFGITILSKLGLLKLLGGRGGIKWFRSYSFDGKRRAFNQATKNATLIRQNYRCNICGSTPENWDFDHIESRADNSYGNCQALCLDCHRNKTRFENR